MSFFGNGHRDQAVSRTDLTGTALGSISFYVLGGLAKGTPPLIGARTFRGKNAMLCPTLMDVLNTMSPIPLVIV